MRVHHLADHEEGGGNFLPVQDLEQLARKERMRAVVEREGDLPVAGVAPDELGEADAVLTLPLVLRLYFRAGEVAELGLAGSGGRGERLRGEGNGRSSRAPGGGRLASGQQSCRAEQPQASQDLRRQPSGSSSRR
jgi:hypothetical protein